MPARAGVALASAATAAKTAAQAIAADLLGRDPNDTGLKRLQGGIKDETAKTLAFAGRGAEALALIPSALAHSSEELTAQPENPGVVREYAFSLMVYAEIMEKVGTRTNTCAMARDAVNAWDRAAKLNPLSEYDSGMLDYTRAMMSRACET